MVLGVGVGPGGEVVAAAPVATAISVVATSKNNRRPMVLEGGEAGVAEMEGTGGEGGGGWVKVWPVVERAAEGGGRWWVGEELVGGRQRSVR